MSRIMALKLPPLNGLRSFEAAARHLSFKRAAQELNLTPSAVSHGIQTLEDWLGTSLFHRGVRGLSLTKSGAAYAESVGQALALLGEATFRIAGRRSTGALSISSAPTFASRWLVPRLSRFTQRHPDVRIALDTSHVRVEFPSDTVDLAIRFSDSASDGETWIHLVDESFAPVCSPTLLRQVEDGLSMFAAVPLIHVSSVSRGWPEWFRAAAVAPPTLDRGLTVDTINMSLDAAKKGLGMALGRLPLIDADIAQGELVLPCGPAIQSGLSYWLVGAASTFDRPEAKAFKRWLLEELRDPGASLTPGRGRRSTVRARAIRDRTQATSMSRPP